MLPWLNLAQRLDRHRHSKVSRGIRRCSEFDVPPEGANTTAGAECSDYDTWNHGVFNMSKAHHNRYVRKVSTCHSIPRGMVSHRATAATRGS
jgi:hypothetical protein